MLRIHISLSQRAAQWPIYKATLASGMDVTPDRIQQSMLGILEVFSRVSLRRSIGSHESRRIVLNLDHVLH